MVEDNKENLGVPLRIKDKKPHYAQELQDMRS